MKLVWVISYSSLLAFCLFCAAGDGKLKVWCRIDAYVDHKWYGQFPKSLQIRCSIIWHLDINFNKVWYRIWKRTPGLDKINGTFCFVVLKGECTHTHWGTTLSTSPQVQHLSFKSSTLPIWICTRDIPIYKKSVSSYTLINIRQNPRSANLREIFYTIGIFFHRVENKSTINQNQCR